MKRLIPAFLFVLLIYSSTTTAQTPTDTSRHLAFKGVPLNGTLAEYVLKMKAAGFTHEGTRDGVALLIGEFAAYKRCRVSVATLKQKDLVSKITVALPGSANWAGLSGNYFNLKDLLTAKYGAPSASVERFQSYTPDNDGARWRQVKRDACEYYTTFETAKGTIHLSIENSEEKTPFVRLVYFDKLNNDAVKKEALKDLRRAGLFLPRQDGNRRV